MMKFKNRNLVFEIFIVLVVIIGFSYPEFSTHAATGPKYSISLDHKNIQEDIKETTDSPLSPLTKKKKLLLTIDDGPSNKEVDEKILQILRKHSAKSIWFINCKNIDPLTNANAKENLAELRRISNTGNIVENHTYNHLNLVELSAENELKMHSEILECSKKIKQFIGIKPTYFRAPWGLHNDDVVDYAKSIGMTTMDWSSTTLDTATNEKVREQLAAYYEHMPAADGDIVLLHDTKFTADQLDKLLTNFDQQGFEYVLPN